MIKKFPTSTAVLLGQVAPASLAWNRLPHGPSVAGCWQLSHLLLHWNVIGSETQSCDKYG